MKLAGVINTVLIFFLFIRVLCPTCKRHHRHFKPVPSGIIYTYIRWRGGVQSSKLKTDKDKQREEDKNVKIPVACVHCVFLIS
jgi:hypothetical protein